MPYKIYLYDTDTDDIGSGSLSAAALQTQLQTAAGQDVEVHISSAGGSAFDAIAMYDLLKNYPGQVTTCVDALAASAASIVAMGGHCVSMSKYALLMIHKPMVGSGGNADQLLQDVQMLNTVQTRLAQIYIDKTGLDAATINSLINSVTWMTADQAFALGFIDAIEEYQPEVTNSLVISRCTGNAPAVYQRCINKILNHSKTNRMNTPNHDMADKTTSVLNKMMNFFKKVLNKQTITDKGPLHHTGIIEPGTEVYQDEDMSTPAADDVYTTSTGQQLSVQSGKVQAVAQPDPAASPEDDDDSMPDSKLPIKIKPADVQNQIAALKARMHAQSALLAEARAALEAASLRLKQTRDEVKNEIKSTFTPENSKRSNKAKAESQPFFAPQSPLAQNAVKHAVKDLK